MIDHEEIYRSEAERYDLLVSREDYRGGILAALREIRELTGLEVADNRNLPLEDGSVDLSLSGWSIGYFAAPDNPEWQLDVERTLGQMERILRPGGTIIILETLGTGTGEPQAPTPELQAYYTYLEEQQGFKHTWIRTDYRFSTVDEAEQIIEFFFGEPLSARVRNQKLTVVPECTGIWWRQF